LAQTLPGNAVAEIFSPTANPPFVQRHRLLHELDRTSVDRHADEFLEFLKRRDPPPEMREDDFHSLKNDASALLIRHRVRPVEHLRLSLDCIADADAFFVWRDYCLQFLPALLGAEELPPEDFRRGTTLLDELTAQSVPGLTGTALIAARRLSRSPLSEAAPSPEELSRRALLCARNADARLIDRVTALQVAAELKNPGAFDFAAELIKNPPPDEQIMLRVSALAALGYSGDPARLPLLEPFQLSPDIRLRNAARGAIRRLSPPSP
jgi:hypothetical protein